MSNVNCYEVPPISVSIRDRAVAAVRGRSSNGKRRALGMTHSSPRTGGKSRAQFRASKPDANSKHGAVGIIHRELDRAVPGGLGLLPVNNSATPIRDGMSIAHQPPNNPFPAPAGRQGHPRRPFMGRCRPAGAGKGELMRPVPINMPSLTGFIQCGGVGFPHRQLLIH